MGFGEAWFGKAGMVVPRKDDYMVYQWKYQLRTDPNIVGKEFEAIEAENGQLTKEAVVDRARNAANPLHDLFQWNDTIAAEEYRKVQAHKLITNLVVVQANVDSQKKPVTYCAFVNVNERVHDEGRYINLQKAIESEEAHELLLKNAIRELQSFKHKYETLSELRPVMNFIDNYIEGGTKNA